MLNRDQAVQISRWISGKSFVGNRKKFNSTCSLIVCQCRDLRIGGDVAEFGSLKHSPGKRVLTNLKTICLRFWKVVVQRVAVINIAFY